MSDPVAALAARLVCDIAVGRRTLQPHDVLFATSPMVEVVFDGPPA